MTAMTALIFAAALTCPSAGVLYIIHCGGFILAKEWSRDPGLCWGWGEQREEKRRKENAVGRNTNH